MFPHAGGLSGLGTPGCVLGAFAPIPDPGWASRAHADRARGRSVSEGRRHGRLGGRVVRVCPCRLGALALDVALSCFCACPASPARVARRVACRRNGRRHARGGSARESAGGHQLWLLLPAGTRPRPSAAASWVVRERGWPLSRARGVATGLNAIVTNCARARLPGQAVCPASISWILPLRVEIEVDPLSAIRSRPVPPLPASLRDTALVL